MSDFLWRVLAAIASLSTNWLIRRAQRRPYTHILSPDGKDVYMWRGWLFNPYEAQYRKPGLWRKLPSVRLHHIMQPDQDRHCHDHPWDARTIILRGWYAEARLKFYPGETPGEILRVNVAGDTATLKRGEFHRIERVSPGGVWTLFITWKYQGSWGFYTEHGKVHHRVYLDARTNKPAK